MHGTAGVVLITGAASGMGASAVTLFLERGYRVLGVDVAPTAAPRGFDASYVSLVVDVRSRAALEAAIESALELEDAIDVVANIAGVYPPTTLETFDDEVFHRIFDINVLGILNVIAAARPRLARGASIVNFASVDAFEVSRGQLLYGASKAAVVMLTKSLALELAPQGIRVNGIAPGWVATPGNAATGRMDAAAASIPLGRVAQPEEIAAWVWLISQPDYGAFLTGETVVLSGGDVMR